MNCIITGGTKGIGKACAELFARKGYDVAICARNPAELNAVLQELNTLHPSGRHLAMECDVKVQAQLQAFADACLLQFGSIDILINNVGVFLPGNLHDEPTGNLEHLMETNVYSVYHLTRMLVPSMINAKRGHIFNLCSVASINAYDAGGSYAITKFALYGFSKNLRHELKPHGIRVTAVLPGATLTPSWAGTELPESRFIPAEDVAAMILHISELSERSVVEEILIRPQLGDI